MIYSSVPGLCPYFQPFYQPNECGKALCVRPDMMELDELYEFPEFSRDPTMYLALRNLILASWHKNCKVHCQYLFTVTQNPDTVWLLDFEQCFFFLRMCSLHRNVPNTSSSGGWCVCAVCRRWSECSTSWPGRASSTRVCWQWNSLSFQRDIVLWVSPLHTFRVMFISVKYSSTLSFLQKNVLVIGAGASGLAAARQLQNFGTQVKNLTSYLTLYISHRTVLYPCSSFPLVYRWWCLRQERELGVGCGTILLWASL